MVMGRDKGFLVATEFFPGSVSRHGYQILSHRNCRNMAFLVATGVLFLYRDDVVIEVSLSRSRRSR